MKKYTLHRYHYSSDIEKTIELEAEDVKFENNRVNFYIGGVLVRSYPSEVISILSIKQLCKNTD